MKFAIDKAMLSVNQMAAGLFESLPGIVLGLFVFFLFFMAGKLTRRLAFKITKRTQGRNNVGLLVGRLGQGFTVFIGILIASVIAVPDFTAAKLFSFLGVGSVAIGFAFRDILQNFLAGILILINQPFRIGDQIIADKLEGTVEDIQTRATYVRTYDGRRVVVPNTDLFTGLVTVNTAFATRRLEHIVGISYNDDIETAIGVLEEVMRHAPSVLGDPEPDAFVVDFNDSSIDIQMFWWISSPYQKDVIYSRGEVLRQAKRALDEAGITIPFPIRTLDFGLARRDSAGDGNALLAEYLSGAQDADKSSHADGVELEKSEE